ncbi:MAG: hypothetical protein ACE5FF_03815 [Saprospiraceae bacterium]
MKLTSAIFSIAIFSGLMACTSDPAPTAGEQHTDTPAEAVAPMTDSARITFIDKYIRELSQKNRELESKQYPLNFLSSKDAVLVVRQNGAIVRGGVRLYSDEMETRSVYHVRDGKLIHVDHREWHKLDDPYAIQYLAFFDDNEKIFKLSKRIMKLESGEKPGNVVSEPLIEDMANADSLVQVFKADWERVVKAVEAR